MRAEALYAASLTFAQAIGDRRPAAILLNDLGEMALHRGDMQRALTLHLDALALARVLGDQRAIARLLNGLRAVARTAGDLGLPPPTLKKVLRSTSAWTTSAGWHGRCTA
jgi:hypothetical protein